MTVDAETHLQALIAEAEILFSSAFPLDGYPGMTWHAKTWDHARSGTVKTRRSTVSFLAHPLDGSGHFHPRFEYALKAYIVYAEEGPSKAVSVIGGARALWSVLLNEIEIDQSRFRWNSVNQAVLDGIERYLLDVMGVGESTAVIYLMALDNFLDWLRLECILPAGLQLKRSLRLKNPRSLSPEDRTARQEKMVSRETLNQLASFYATATEPRDRLLICAIGLLVIAGFRISELLVLPADGLQKEVVDGRERWYIRYWQSKSGAGKKLEENKRWLSPLGAELAQRLWSEILERTDDARRMARRLDADEGRVRIPWLPNDAVWATADDLSRAFGWASKTARSSGLKKAKISGVAASVAGVKGVRANSTVWRVDEIEALLQSRRGPLITHIAGSGKVQRLPETLLIAFEQFMDKRKQGSEVLVRRISRCSIEEFLVGRNPISPLSADQKAHTHGFRHWLNTVANKSGMSAFLISVWMQRANIEHTLFYLHDPLDVAEMAREGLRYGKLVGGGADRMYGLEEGPRDRQIDSIQMAHVAATVICGLDLIHEECPEAKLCELCGFGFYDPESAQMRRALAARLRSLESNRERLVRLRERGTPIHDRQFQQAEEAIAEIRRRLGHERMPVTGTQAYVQITPHAEVAA